MSKLSLLTLTTTLFLQLVVVSVALDPNHYGVCLPVRCGDVNISYPFYIPNKQRDFCGYPGFEVVCQNGEIPHIKISGDSYAIRNIWDKNQSFQVANSAFVDSVGDNNCFDSIRNLTLPDNIFSFAEKHHKNIFLLPNCTKKIVEEYPRYLVKCGALGFYEGDPGLKNLRKECGQVVSVPYEGTQNGVADIMKVLSRGVVLNWTANNCSACIETGGQCGFDRFTHETWCYCPDRAHSYHCVPTPRKKDLPTLGVLIGISISIAVLLCAAGVWIYMRKTKASKSAYAAEINEIKNTEFLAFDFGTIIAATRDFSPDNRLGEGGFGEVYKGILENGQEVAIKRLAKTSGQGIKEFKTEVDLVAKLQHNNLVKLLGYCLSSTEKILVYEFLQNSSLDTILFDPTKKRSLDWGTRFNLIMGVARGLLYLHQDSRLKVIHRDLKPSNILLDDSMNPKISDFGLAKLFGVDQTQNNTKRIVGTYGYMAPEYAMVGHFSMKSDVYSFGIIMLEIISGQRSTSLDGHEIDDALLYRAWRLWNEGKALCLVDKVLGKQYNKEEIERCIHIALMCIQENPRERPRMATVIGALNERSISLPMPKPPNFFCHADTKNDTSSSQSDGLLCEYHQEWEQKFYPFAYSGSEDITELHPR